LSIPNYNSMNIIALFEKLQLDKASIATISTEEVIRIEKRIALEKRIDAEIDTNAATNLVEALRNYRDEMAFIVGHRTFYNFLSDKNYSRNIFKFPVPEVDSARIRSFFDRFLEEDLVLMAERDLSENNFFNLISVCFRKEYLPESILFRMHKKLIGKLELALGELHNGTVSGTSEGILTNREFYELLNCFSDTVTDEKVTMLINIVAKMHNNAASKNRLLTRNIMIAMSEYKPFDDQLADIIERNKKVMTTATTSSDRSSGSSFPWWKALVFVVLLIRIVIAMSKSSSAPSTDYDSYDYGNYQPKDYKTAEVDPVYFFNYLTNYDKADLAQNFMMVDVPNEGIPFHGMYDGMIPSSGASPVEFFNKTAYDVILLVEASDNTRSSVYIQSGMKASINIGNRNFRFYFGKKLASFGPENSTYQRRNADNTRKVQEYRFSELPENCRFMLDKQFDIKSNAVIMQAGKNISIESEGMECLTDPEPIKGGKYIFGKEETFEKIIEESQAAP
jgi:hypothetical protein